MSLSLSLSGSDGWDNMWHFSTSEREGMKVFKLRRTHQAPSPQGWAFNTHHPCSPACVRARNASWGFKPRISGVTSQRDRTRSRARTREKASIGKRSVYLKIKTRFCRAKNSRDLAWFRTSENALHGSGGWCNSAGSYSRDKTVFKMSKRSFFFFYDKLSHLSVPHAVEFSILVGHVASNKFGRCIIFAPLFYCTVL